MDKLYIPQLLQHPQRTLAIEINSHLPDLETLTPVRGAVTMTHEGTYLAVKGEAETIVTLSCHRCLQNYNYRVVANPQELIWLQAFPDLAALPLEQEVGMDELVETLPPDGYFYPKTWLYEQICLALPQRQICSPDCRGIEVASPVDQSQEKSAVDSRWAVLTQLQRQLNEATDGHSS